MLAIMERMQCSIRRYENVCLLAQYGGYVGTVGTVGTESAVGTVGMLGTVVRYNGHGDTV